ncbi:hypothetical protein Pmar_PMAR008920 [Perkinsus marinus ATCC 50983]|uniref:Uncharacterized protein n=1 Tax=Perkinsus marinus (strain ATCC 50983 / TXsc) TaxID=423536 RepID=C5KAC9_PERM5|nr:hypothetical protein Pmar_PMAR008920 [Perkinsus marinus ATCC 50983]EER18590.1 hypothetical protein Pmar_PMAR008920 [Perkinsus marinus ATCC 50983]|eukprot:XP_002786794.1 hypothetical protein Pmar_PMAR008920 [Perkinsus marinus ATCC 50983]
MAVPFTRRLEREIDEINDRGAADGLFVAPVDAEQCQEEGAAIGQRPIHAVYEAGLAAAGQLGSMMGEICKGDEW